MSKKRYRVTAALSAILMLLVVGGSVNAPKASSDAMIPRAYLPVIAKGFETQGDSSRYNFEIDTQSWWPDMDSAAFRVTCASNYAYQGVGSLRLDFIDLNGGTEPPNGKPANVKVWTSDISGYGPGAQIVARVLASPGSPAQLRGLIFVQDANYTWTPSVAQTLVPGSWTTLTFTIPPSARLPIRYTGLQIYNPTGAGSWTGSVYLDSIDW